MSHRHRAEHTYIGEKPFATKFVRKVLSEKFLFKKFLFKKFLSKNFCLKNFCPKSFCSEKFVRKVFVQKVFLWNEIFCTKRRYRQASTTSKFFLEDFVRMAFILKVPLIMVYQFSCIRIGFWPLGVGKPVRATPGLN
jgi:hypothetical protein